MCRKLACTAFVGLALGFSGVAAKDAQALLFDWSFTSGPGFDNPGEVISGTIDGLVEGSNDGTLVIVEVLSTPIGELLGGGWNFIDTALGGSAFTVTGGEITFADAQFGRPTAADLFFGTDPQGVGTFFPQLRILPAGSSPNWANVDLPNVFTPVVVQDPPPDDKDNGNDIPEPATLALFGIGLVGLRYVRSRRNF